MGLRGIHKCVMFHLDFFNRQNFLAELLMLSVVV